MQMQLGIERSDHPTWAGTSAQCPAARVPGGAAAKSLTETSSAPGLPAGLY